MAPGEIQELFLSAPVNRFGGHAILGELHPSCFCLDEGFIMGACKLWE